MGRESLPRWWYVGAAVLGLGLPTWSQLTSMQQHEWLNSPAAVSHIGDLTGKAKRAAMDYRRFCVGCHGELGDGNGENAAWLDPKPRDFTLGVFKCRSTPSGTLPTDEDLYDTIARGLDRSNMPVWSTLNRRQLADLVAWIKHFSPRWQKEKAGAPIPIPAEPEVTPERVKQGREVYGKLQCSKCHGVQGTANGPSASTLTDDANRPIVAYNFTDGSRPKCGESDRDIYRMFMTGLDGTPMPSYADNIQPEEAWDLVFYLRTFQPPNQYNRREKEIARQLALPPVDPNVLPQ